MTDINPSRRGGIVKQYIVGIGLLASFLVAGCTGTGERIELKVPIAGMAGNKATAMSSATVAIQPFEDQRTERLHLGTRYHLWGGESRFNVPGGTLGEATAQAFVDYLKGKGWNATVAQGTEAAAADITVSGKIVDLSVDARSGIGRTTLNAKSRMVVHVNNLADGSQVRETLSSTGTNQVFWFDPEDAQELLDELYNKNFEKFAADTKLDGKILKLR
jgi:hypothetical protein